VADTCSWWLVPVVGACAGADAGGCPSVEKLMAAMYDSKPGTKVVDYIFEIITEFICERPSTGQQYL
jgi:hypothetical protein